MTTKEIADRINAHLKRFEADPTINKTDPTYKTKAYWNADAYASGRYVRVTYIAYQGSSSLPKADAEKYLAWLDAGNVGRHYQALQQKLLS